ncbi:hypothetical protein [Corynebacterium pseudokroppenstedtii]|uniref:hypothetical protein n=1 Tax=Corynebacterium pseudokroppenstedtii TaxID=2804917 RepID=UPI00307AB477
MPGRSDSAQMNSAARKSGLFPWRAFYSAWASEWVRLSGWRGPFIRVLVPLGIVLPLVVTLVIGGVAESLHGNGGLIQVREVSTTNANYWVIYLGITMYAVVATYAQASSMRGPVGELDSVLHPRPVPSIIARWLVVSVAAAIGSFFSVLMVMVALPALYPQVYGSVSASSVEGVRFLWAAPLYAVAACGIGVGIGALVAVPAAAITVITVWSLLIENAVVFVPHGGELVGWMPFLNGIYGTGQEIALEPPWSSNGSLLYVMVWAAVIMLLGTCSAVRRSRRPR